jgi:hypothetical protein
MFSSAQRKCISFFRKRRFSLLSTKLLAGLKTVCSRADRVLLLLIPELFSFLRVGASRKRRGARDP